MKPHIDSANDRLPTGQGGRIWLGACVLLALLLGGWEFYWRSRGWTSTVEANQESWVLARARIRPTSTVIAGTSRIQGALDPDAWRAATGGPAPIQLAIAGTSPVPMLEELAADSAFHGLLLAELMPYYTFDSGIESERITRDYQQAFHLAQESPVRRWESYFRTRIPNHFVFRRTKLLPNHFYATLKARDLDPPQSYLRPDRFQPVAFPESFRRLSAARMSDPNRFRNLARNSVPATGARLDSLRARIRASTARITARGGRVVLIFLEACGPRKVVENRLYPKATYWDWFTGIPGVQLIDSDNHPEIANLPCFDGSHVDASDAPAVTQLLARLIVREPPGSALPERFRQ